MDFFVVLFYSYLCELQVFSFSHELLYGLQCLTFDLSERHRGKFLFPLGDS